MLFSIAVMTHPSRHSRLLALIDDLSSQIDIGQVSIVVDRNCDGIWETASRAWLSFDISAQYHLVLQDDALLCDNFVKHLPSVIGSLPSDATVSFCDNFPVMNDVVRKNKHWLVISAVHNACALLQPVSQIKHFVEWNNRHVRPEYFHDDLRLDMYLKKHDKTCWHTLPQLVRHDNQGSVHSMVSGIQDKRSALPTEFNWIGKGVDITQVDWSTANYNVHYTRPYTELNIGQRWAIGEVVLDSKQETMLKSINSLIWNDDSLRISYQEAMIKKPRGEQ